MGQETIRGMISQIQDFSLFDGDGIRTTVFFSGCPLRCRWCANPETWEGKPVLAVHGGRCTGCGSCYQACPHQALAETAPHRPVKSRCISCGACTAVCPAGAREVMGKVQTVDEVVEQVMSHQVFFRRSGGGVTFSGGEATAQPLFLNALTETFSYLGVDMALETCGFFQWQQLEPVLNRLDLIYFDVKLMDEAAHRFWAGQSNGLILENLKRLAELPARVVVRIPLISGVNDSEENLIRTAGFVKQHVPGGKIELLPCHSYGVYKYQALGLTAAPAFSSPGQADLERAAGILKPPL